MQLSLAPTPMRKRMVTCLTWTLLGAGALLLAACAADTAADKMPTATSLGPAAPPMSVTPPPSPLIHLTGTNAAVDPNGNLVEDGNIYGFVYKPVPLQKWVRQPWISPSQSYLGYPGIGLESDPNGQPLPPGEVSDAESDKANLQLATSTFGTMVYWGFALQLGAGHFAVPTGEILLTQMWQGAPYSPPVSLHLIANDQNFTCEVQIRNNTTGGNPDAAVIHLPVGTCAPGMWHAFRIGVLPRYAGQTDAGQVTVWHDDMKNPVAHWSGDIGYDPTVPVNVNGIAGMPQSTTHPDRLLTIYFGPYRSSQHVPAQTFWTNVKFAMSPTGADPTVP